MKDSLLYIERHPLGGPKKGFQGDAFYTAENPPYGAVFTAYLKEKMKTKKEKRQDAEKEAAKKNQTLPYPTNDELRAEAEEAKPEVYFVVYDESGAPIRRVEGSMESGFQRAAWDLRYSAPSMGESTEEGERFCPGGNVGAVGDFRELFCARCFRRWMERLQSWAGRRTSRW